MPARYVAMRDKFREQGLSEKEAETRAAKIFNATRKPWQKPVTGSDSKAAIKS